MSAVRLIADLHFGHKGIQKFRPFTDEEEHREVLIDNWNSVVGKRDVVWVLGDVVFRADFLPELNRLRGQKFLVLGNHDLDGRLFAPFVNKVYGVVKYKGFWLSHAPIHPAELRGVRNIHGHVHYATLEDKANYFNVSAENIGYTPILLEEVRSFMNDKRTA